VVGAVEDEVVLGDYADGVLGGEVLAVGVVFDVWVEAWARSAWGFMWGWSSISDVFKYWIALSTFHMSTVWVLWRI
jgi:hypothetical protein